ncbi:hypothetical protein KY335_02565 [Candidatus Woesearchaeota archaeon]|nr:hypothetical protein [Candidatus Woesearchaeota archaeon]MBW3014102.1 hypothetical protein [Candidatus Woesearchaeota archaeon]
MADISNRVQTRLWDENVDHVAYMNPQWKLVPKILSGEKPIESRWYMTKRDPWDNIHPGDKVYFKDSGKPVTVQAEVANVRQFSGLNEERIRMILEEYGKQIGIEDVEKSVEYYKGKKYCILIFLRDPKQVEQPFEIDKKGFGSGTAWICVQNIDSIRKDL